MISTPPGWTSVHRDGGLVLVPPEGAGYGVLRYVERVRPLAAVSTIMAAARAPLGWREEHVSPIERVITEEGEYAGFAWKTGTIDDTPCERTFGIVFGDDFYARLTGVCFKSDHFARFRDTARDIIRRDAHVLGVRRRRFVYRAPRGWTGLRDNVFHASWLAPSYPRDRSVIVVMPAVPVVPGLREVVLEGVIGGTSPEEALLEPARAIEAREQLAGETFRIRGPNDTETTLAILTDARYFYCVRLDTQNARAEEARAALFELTSTIEPLPDRDRIETSRSAIMTHWVE